MRPRDQKGQAVILAITVMLVIFIIVIFSLTLSENQKTASIYHREKVQAYYNADSGIERVIAKLCEDPEWVNDLHPNQAITFYEDEYTKVTVIKHLEFEEEILVVQSVGFYNHGKQSLEAMIKLEKPPKILSWNEIYPVLPD